MVGTSITTVYRVLNNKEGVGDELREKILKVVKESGYTVNFAASSLSKKTTTIVTIFPKEGETSKYFIDKIYQGYCQSKKNVCGFNISFIEYFYEGNCLYQILEDLYNDTSLKIDGMIVYPMRSTQVINVLNRFSGRGIPFVMIDENLPEVEPLACIKPNDEIAGRLSGELISKFIHFSGKVLVIDADAKLMEPISAFDDINGTNFEKVVKEIQLQLQKLFMNLVLQKKSF